MHALTKDFSDITKGILDVLIHPHKQKEGHPFLCSLKKYNVCVYVSYEEFRKVKGQPRSQGFLSFRYF